jgi:PAS domain S-box-containing protein
LLFVLAGVAAVALWRAHSEQSARRSLERRAFAVAALEGARAQIFLTATFSAISVFADDPGPFVDQYHKGRAAAYQSLQEARDKLTAAGGPDDSVALDELVGEADRLFQDADRIVDSFLTGDRDTRVETGQQYLQQLWPAASTAIVSLEQMAQEQEAKLISERAAADRTSQTTLALLITFSAFAFLTASVALLSLFRSVARPLAALRASARAVTSGNLNARAKVSGPEEVASLAHDFNEMTEALLDRTVRLQQSERRFRDVLDVSRDLVYKLNLQTRTYDYVSPSAVQLLGFTPQEITAMGVEEVRKRFHPEDRARFRASPADPPDDTVEDRMAPAIEYRWQCRDGEYRWFSDDRAFVRDDDGRLLAVVGTVHDITNRKAAEDALRQSEEKFRTLSASAPIGIFSTDPQGKFIYANQHLLDALGLRLEEVLGRGWSRNVHPDDRPAAIEEALKAGSELRTFSWEYRIVKPGGEVRWVRTVSSPILSRDGSFVSYVGVAADITEEKRAADALHESEEKFRTLSASAPIGIFSTDPQGNFIYANQHLLDTFGLRLEELLGRGWIKNVHPDDRQAAVEESLKARSELRTFSWEYRILRAGGEVRWVRTVANPILSKDGSPVSYVGAGEDITEEKRIEEDKQRAFEDTVMLLAVAAEARDPYTENHLLRIRGYSEAIASELGLSAQEVTEIGLGSLLHDIGKMRVPDPILTKPGSLTAEEWQIMKQHPIWGEELLSLHPPFETARQIARWHHENWDGTGYPDGLRGEEIPIGAAVTAVADGFDAMTTERPYKGAWPPGRAIREIRQNKGLRYSPKVVEAFDRALHKGKIKKIAMTSPPSISDLVKAA